MFLDDETCYDCGYPAEWTDRPNLFFGEMKLEIRVSKKVLKTLRSFTTLDARAVSDRKLVEEFLRSQVSDIVLRGKMPKYVAVDSDNNWLFYGEANSPQEVYKAAMLSEHFLASNRLYVYTVTDELVFEPDEESLFGEYG